MADPQPTPSPSSSTHWGANRTIGRYTLLAKLATGGMAEIFLARQAGPKGFEKLLVVKKILDTYAEDPDFVAMFLDEARIAAQLNHPHIVQIYDLGEDRGSYYIAMEYLAGESLSLLARTARKVNQPLPVPMSVKLISQAAEALNYAHRKTDSAGHALGIVHRDISPQNLFVTYEGSLKVLDFGIAKAANKASHTQDGQVKGKLAYMSPEQARGLDVDGRSDVFALGVVLFELVTATRLFHQDDPVRTFSAVVGPAPIPRARERVPELDPALDAIIAHSLEREVGARFANAEEFHETLEEWLRTVKGPSSSAIGAYMTSLFSDRINQRLALVERASQGEEISSGVNAIVKREDTDLSMPGNTSPRVPVPAPAGTVKTSHVALGIGLGVVLLAVGGIAAYFSGRPSEVRPVVVATVAPPAPVPQTASLTVSTEPPHAHVTVDGVDRGLGPVTLSDLQLGEHTLLARLEGRVDVTRAVKLEKPGQSLEIVVSLPEVPAAAPPPAIAPAPTVAEPPKAVRRKGKLTLETVPWTKVFEGSKELGDTPLVEVRLSEGVHHLKLQNPDKKIDMVIEVTITADQVTTKKLRL